MAGLEQGNYLNVFASLEIRPPGIGYVEDGVHVKEAGGYDEMYITFPYGSKDYKVLFMPQHPCTSGYISIKGVGGFNLTLEGISKSYPQTTVFGYLLIW